MHVHYARDVWRANGEHIRIRLVILRNFHVQTFSIRVTVYFILILKDLNLFQHLYNYFNSTLSRIVFVDVIMTSAVNRGVDWSN